MHQSKAFTLAEVLIVLFLVGVFATFANPTVMQNPKTELGKLNATAGKVSTTNNASVFRDLPENRISIEDANEIKIKKIAEYKDVHDIPIKINLAKISKEKEDPNYHLIYTYTQKEKNKNKNPIDIPLIDLDKTEAIYNFIKNPNDRHNEKEIGKSILSLLPLIDDNCKNKCFANNYRTISGKTYKTNINSAISKGILNNGARIAVVNGTTNKKFPIIKVYIDLNGKRPPNTRCRDLFEYELYPTLTATQFFPAGKINNYTEVIFTDEKKSSKKEIPIGTFKQIKYSDEQMKSFIYKYGKYCEIKIEHDAKTNGYKSIIKY